MCKATWGDDDGDGVLPVGRGQLAELGAETPVLFDETDGIDFEAVADTEPDVILASYSGLTQEEYDTLSKIAPIVAYPEVAWGTSYEDMIRMNSAALGLADEGDALIDELRRRDRRRAGARTRSSTASGAVLAHRPADLSQIGFYTSHDTRPGFLDEPRPPAARRSSRRSRRRPTDFYVTVSSEVADRFADVDVFVTYGEADGAIVDQVQADPLLSKIPASPPARSRSSRTRRRSPRRRTRRRCRSAGGSTTTSPLLAAGAPAEPVSGTLTPHRRSPDAASLRRPAAVRVGVAARRRRRPGAAVSWRRSPSAPGRSARRDRRRPRRDDERRRRQAAVIKRVPRTVLALLVGAALAVSGATMQAVTRNPLADPGILGVSARRRAGGRHRASRSSGCRDPYAYIGVAIAGAAVAAVFVYAVGSLGRGGATPLKLALAGAAMAAAFSSLLSAILLPRVDLISNFRFWQVGGVGGATWDRIGMVLPFLASGR